MSDLLLDAADSGETEAPVDACWKTVGVRGDGSCPKLKQYVRCLNCPVFESAATRLLNRPIPVNPLPVHAHDRRGKPPAASPTAASESFLLFRIRDEWLALPTQVCQRILPVRTIHSLPHCQSPAVLGVVNVQGDLRMCLSLARLVGFESESTQPAQSAQRDQPRWVSIARNDAEIVFPVDQVDGVHRFDLAAFATPPATLAPSIAAHTRAVAPWQGNTVGVLDADVLFDTMNRSLR